MSIYGDGLVANSRHLLCYAHNRSKTMEWVWTGRAWGHADGNPFSCNPAGMICGGWAYHSPALATEAQRAETVKQGSVHDGAGPQGQRPNNTGTIL